MLGQMLTFLTKPRPLITPVTSQYDVYELLYLENGFDCIQMKSKVLAPKIP